MRPSPWNWANAFTLLRVALVPLFAWLVVWRRPPAPWAAAVVFVAAAATDGLDGWLARRLDLETGLGQFLDPVADKLLVGTALVALALDGRIAWWAVGVIGGREAAVSGLRVCLARRGLALPASRWGKAKTVSQIAAVFALATLPPGHGVAATVLAVALGLTLWSGAQYFVAAAGGRSVVPWR